MLYLGLCSSQLQDRRAKLVSSLHFLSLTYVEFVNWNILGFKHDEWMTVMLKDVDVWAYNVARLSAQA